MVSLINRNPTGRLICLHALTKYLKNEFGTGLFTINDLKYDSGKEDNVLNHCELLVKHPSVSHKICPFLDNPLSNARCYLTQSVQHDTQKSKSASDAMHALDGLGLVNRVESQAKLTERGHRFASTDFSSKEWLRIARAAVLGYGPFVGLLYQAAQLGRTNPRRVTKSSITLGYPSTEEKITEGGSSVTLSTGSQDDTITRTRAVLCSWAVSAGFAIPADMQKPEENSWHVQSLNYVRQEKWSASTYNFYIPDDLFNGSHAVDRPLNYTWMTKSTKALRERGQDEVRGLSLKYEPRVKNRRFAITYALGKCADKRTTLNFPRFVSKLLGYPQLFVINKTEFPKAMTTEARIAFVAGIPFSVKDNSLRPLTKINLNALAVGAPWSVTHVMDEILSDPSVMG